MDESTPPPLTRIQRRALTTYQRYRTRPLTLLQIYLANFRTLSLLAFSLGVTVAVFYFFISPTFSAFVATGAVTIFLRDFGYMRRTALVWPALQDVIDWEKVSERLSK